MHAKANEPDDSSGNFGQFAGDLICGWIKAHCAGDLDRDETVVVLLGWMDDDSFAFLHDDDSFAFFHDMEKRS